MSRPSAVVLGVLLLALELAAPASAQDGVQTLHYEYGPLKIEPGRNTIELEPNTLKPAVDGWITRFVPNLVRADGSVPRVDAIHLHHNVWLKDLQAAVRGRRGEDHRRRPTGPRLALQDHRRMAHEPHDPQPHADSGGGLHHL